MEVGDFQASVEKQEDVTSLRNLASQYKNNADIRAIAHYRSAEYHRTRYMWVNYFLIIISAVVSAGIYKGWVSQSGLDGTQPISTFPKSLVLGIFILSIATPVLQGLQRVWTDDEEVAKHKASVVGYEHVKQRIESFLIGLNSANVKAEEAKKQWDGIMEEFDAVKNKSPQLTQHAFDSATKQWNEMTSSHGA